MPNRHDLSNATLHTEVAPGVHRVEQAYTNWYLLEGGDRRITVVDAGVPASWGAAHDALRRIGRSPEDVEAIVLTHAHFDHVGFAERARTEWGVPVHVHSDDAPLCRHPSRYDHERPRSLYFATQPKALPIIAGLLRHRAFWPAPVEEVTTFGGGTVAVPGSPRILHTPGHTYGHCALHLADRDTVIAGDAIVTLDPYTARTGPRMVARAATADVERNARSLDAIASTGATTVLVGHGEPWTAGAEDAAEQARRAGAA